MLIPLITCFTLSSFKVPLILIKALAEKGHHQFITTVLTVATWVHPDELVFLNLASQNKSPACDAGKESCKIVKLLSGGCED